MISNNKIAHEWMVEYVSLIQSLKTAPANLQALDKANSYRYRLVEDLGEPEFQAQLKLYVEKYERLGFLK